MNLVCPACATTNRGPEERLTDQLVSGRCSAKLMPTEPAAPDDTTFPKHVANTAPQVLLGFWADWCAPCGMIAPHFAKVDSDASPHTRASNAIICASPAHDATLAPFLSDRKSVV